MWRLAMCPDISDSYDTITTRWSLAEVVDANVILDSIEEMRERQRAEQERR